MSSGNENDAACPFCAWHLYWQGFFVNGSNRWHCPRCHALFVQDFRGAPFVLDEEATERERRLWRETTGPDGLGTVGSGVQERRDAPPEPVDISFRLGSWVDQRSIAGVGNVRRPMRARMFGDLSEMLQMVIEGTDAEVADIAWVQEQARQAKVALCRAFIAGLEVTLAQLDRARIGR